MYVSVDILWIILPTVGPYLAPKKSTGQLLNLLPLEKLLLPKENYFLGQVRAGVNLAARLYGQV